MGPKIGWSMKKVATDPFKKHIDTKIRWAKIKDINCFTCRYL